MSFINIEKVCLVIVRVFSYKIKYKRVNNNCPENNLNEYNLSEFAWSEVFNNNEILTHIQALCVVNECNDKVFKMFLNF